VTDHVIGIEIGGTKLQAAIGTCEGELLHIERGAAPREEGAPGILAWCGKTVPLLLKRAGAEGARVSGIGVGFGGPIDTEAGRVLVSHQVEGWQGIPLKQWFEDRFSVPTAVHNDSNAAGWAEYCRGAGRGTRHFYYMNIGSGIGGAIIVDGQLHDGQGFGAGEIGHMHVPDWTAITSGASEKLERLCSGWAIERRLRANAQPRPGTPLYELCAADSNRITCPLIAEAARRRDLVAAKAIDEAARTLGLALANVITLMHPERIALGGGVSLMGEVLIEPLRRYVDQYVFGPFRNRYEIVPCALGESVVVVGALLLAPRVL